MSANEITTNRMEIAWQHIRSTRGYFLTLLEELSDDDWYWSPSPPITHIAWQVGHVAVAQYGLTLFRQRGRQEIDSELMSGQFRKLFMKGTTPADDRQQYPSPAEIRLVLDRVFQQVEQEFPTFNEQEMDDPVDPPHAAFATRYGALLFAADHEMLHAGQIGMLRRLMGKSPLR